MKKKKNILVIPIGAKGGTGKTLALLTLANFLVEHNRPFIALDCDQENRGTSNSFARFLGGAVGTPDLRDYSAIDHLFTAAAECAEGLTLADLPANSGGDVLTWFLEVCTPENLEELGLRVVVLGMVTPETGTVGAILKWAEVMQNRVEYVTVFNHRVSGRTQQPVRQSMREYFETTDGSNFRETFKPVEIELPALAPTAVNALIKSGVLPSAGLEKMAVFERSRIRAWAARINQEWEKAAAALGILE